MASPETQPSNWRAAASPGGLIGLLLTILAFMAAVAAVLGITGRVSLPLPEIALWVVFSLAILASFLFAYLFWGYLSIGYQLDREDLVIMWGVWSERVPLQSIESVSPLEESMGEQGQGWIPFWPGYYIGKRETDSGTIQVISTLPSRRQLLISVEDGRHFAISPERPLLFIEEFTRWHGAVAHPSMEPVEEPVQEPVHPGQQLLNAGWTREYEAVEWGEPEYQTATAVAEDDEPMRGSEHSEDQPRVRVYRSRPSSTSPVLRPIVLRDSIALGLIATGVVTLLAMIGFILIQYDDIPQSIILHWNVDGLPGRVGEPREIWFLPLIAGLVLIGNIGLAWSIALFDRFAARLLLGSTVIVHAVTWVALLMILS